MTELGRSLSRVEPHLIASKLSEPIQYRHQANPRQAKPKHWTAGDFIGRCFHLLNMLIHSFLASMHEALGHPTAASSRAEGSHRQLASTHRLLGSHSAPAGQDLKAGISSDSPKHRVGRSSCISTKPYNIPAWEGCPASPILPSPLNLLPDAQLHESLSCGQDALSATCAFVFRGVAPEPPSVFAGDSSRPGEDDGKQISDASALPRIFSIRPASICVRKRASLKQAPSLVLEQLRPHSSSISWAAKVAPVLLWHAVLLECLLQKTFKVLLAACIQVQCFRSSPQLAAKGSAAAARCHVSNIDFKDVTESHTLRTRSRAMSHGVLLLFALCCAPFFKGR